MRAPAPPLPREGIVLDCSLLPLRAASASPGSTTQEMLDCSKKSYFCRLQQLQSKHRVRLDFWGQGAKKDRLLAAALAQCSKTVI